MVKLPKAEASAASLFDALVPHDPRVTRRPMFGQPAAFANGHLFFGVFDAQVFLRLAEPFRSEAEALPGVRPFEPMPGRPMREYRVFPSSVLKNPTDGTRWIDRALRSVLALPPKPAGGRRAPGPRPAPRPVPRRSRRGSETR
jgi:TfoX/Sxy family transcriptional regulator of competence genes